MPLNYKVFAFSQTDYKYSPRRSFSRSWTVKTPARIFPKQMSFEYGAPSDVGIPGFDRLFNKRYGIFGKVLWSLAITAAFVGCFYQISLRMRTYLHHTISVDVTVESINTINFPAATICPYQPFIYNKEVNNLRRRYANETNIAYQPLAHHYTRGWKDKPAVHQFDLLKLDNVSADMLWNTASINRTHIENNTHVLALHKHNTSLTSSYNCVHCDNSPTCSCVKYTAFVHPFGFKCEYQTQKNCHLELLYEEIPSYMGTCLTIRLNDTVIYDGNRNGFQIMIHGYENELEYWHYTLELHDTEYNPTHDLLYKDVGQLFHPHFETMVTFYTKQYRRANTPQRPCIPANQSRFCTFSCVEEHIAANVTCTLPYLHRHDLPVCKNPEDAKHTYKVTFEVYDSMHDLCSHCHRACEMNYYSMIQDVVKETGNITVFKVQMAENSVEYITELTPYSLAALLSDIGGSLGFFLGVCTLTGLQLLECFAVSLWLFLSKLWRSQ